MLALWNNFRELDRELSAFDEMRREMDWFFSGRTLGPRIKLIENDDELVVRAVVPGIEEKDLEITLERGTLTIRGERKEDPPKGWKALRKERGSLRFSHSFMLPSRVDGEKAKASLKEGVLELVLPKAEEAKPRQIPVATA